jgi:hypothetical protein
MSIKYAIKKYIEAILPEIQDWALEMEFISRCADDREDIEAAWESLTEDQRHQVRLADAVLVSSADLVAEFWRTDEVGTTRDRDGDIPLDHWWYWLDKIAEGSYPEEYIPEWAK